MSTRDRSPRPTLSRYITPEGAKKLRAELDQLWTIERPRVTQEVADAAAQGDRSENAEYIYGKRRLREIDRRVQFLAKRLEEVTVVSEPPRRPGARVLRRPRHDRGRRSSAPPHRRRRRDRRRSRLDQHRLAGRAGVPRQALRRYRHRARTPR
jgi:hypothetical protein